MSGQTYLQQQQFSHKNPKRYQWDNGYHSLDIQGRVKSVLAILFEKAWEEVPDKLVLYDYIGSNPCKGGFFRSGPILKGDGVSQVWLGHASFEIGTSCRICV